MLSISQLLALLAVLLVGNCWLDRRAFSELGLGLGKQWCQEFGFGLLLGLVLIGVAFEFLRLCGWVQVVAFFRYPTSEYMSFEAALLEPLALFFCVGVFEEVLVRGYILRNLAEGFAFLPARWAVGLAWLLSSLIFGIAHIFNPHASIVSTLTLVLAGLFLGLGYVLTGRLGLPIGLHIAWNFAQGDVFGFPVSGLRMNATLLATQTTGPTWATGGAFGPEAGVAGLVALTLGIVTILGYEWKRSGRVALLSALAQPPRGVRQPGVGHGG